MKRNNIHFNKFNSEKIKITLFQLLKSSLSDLIQGDLISNDKKHFLIIGLFVFHREQRSAGKAYLSYVYSQEEKSAYQSLLVFIKILLTSQWSVNLSFKKYHLISLNIGVIS